MKKQIFLGAILAFSLSLLGAQPASANTDISNFDYTQGHRDNYFLELYLTDAFFRWGNIWGSYAGRPALTINDGARERFYKAMSREEPFMFSFGITEQTYIGKKSIRGKVIKPTSYSYSSVRFPFYKIPTWWIPASHRSQWTQSGNYSYLHTTFKTLTLPAPRDVKRAWFQGWTGNGQRVLLIDGFGIPGEKQKASDNHGYAVWAAVMSIAPRSWIRGVNAFGDNKIERLFDTSARGYGDGGVQNRLGQTKDWKGRELKDERYSVVNISFGRGGHPFTGEVELIDVQSVLGEEYVRDLIGDNPVVATNLSDAVITKAVGNESVDSAYNDAINLVLLTFIPSTQNRTLLVGATDGYAAGSTEGVSLADYSNFAGADRFTQDRFIVANGNSPFSHDVELHSEGKREKTFTLAKTRGTSLSAPRVAGYVAIVRQKFPRLTAEQTTSVILETATYKGLTCYPNCARNIYGRGRVDLPKALSPIGDIR